MGRDDGGGKSIEQVHGEVEPVFHFRSQQAKAGRGAAVEKNNFCAEVARGDPRPLRKHAFESPNTVPISRLRHFEARAQVAARGAVGPSMADETQKWNGLPSQPRHLRHRMVGQLDDIQTISLRRENPQGFEAT